MLGTAFITVVLALQGAGQNPPTQNPNQVQPPVQTQKQPDTATQAAPPVPTSIPGKYIAPAPAAGSAVAKVDGQPIYGHDVEAMLWESLGAQAVEDFINLVMVRQAAAKQDIHVQQAEVEKRLKEDIKLYEDSSKTDRRRTPEMSVEVFLLQLGYPMSRLYLSTEIEVLLDKMAEKTFKPESFVKVSLMLFKPDAPTAAAIATAQQSAQAAVARIKAGTSKWDAEIAKSQMPAEYISKAGLLGWQDAAAFPPDVMQKIKALQLGQISDPIKVENQGVTSFQVFRLEQLGSKAVGSDLDTLKARYAQGQHGTLLNAIRSAAKVDRFPSSEPAAAAAIPPPPAAPPKGKP